ncbi:MAG TPA: hypothetical protein EYQ26_15635 [Rhodospirillales bacterium]|nr:hypothetical protein [Rhodospirillales bacterium]
MNDFYELANRYLAMFEGASVKCQNDIDASKVNKKKSASRRDPCDLYVANGENKGIDMQRAGTATTVICRVPGLDNWPFHSKSGDSFIYSKDIAIIEAMGGTSTLPPEHLRDVTEGEENDDDAWPEEPEEDAPFDDSSPTVW